MKGETQALADSIFAAVKGYCDAALERLLRRAIEPIEQRLDALPPPGRDGADGKDGRDGKDADPVDMVALSGQIAAAVAAAIPQSKSADQIAAEVLVKVTEALDAIPVPKDGKDGKDADPEFIAALVEQQVRAAVPPARDGKDGSDGKDGKDGKDADPEFIRAEVARAIEAVPKPIDGRDGRDGQKGEPGRDAAQIEILPAIDTTRSYPRSTYAQFGGGIIRSTRTTDPVPEGGLLTDAGWSFIVRGISALEMRQLDERNFEFTALFNDGTVERKAFVIPAQIYRGVHIEGKAYDKGDTVTWAGSLWHCDTPTEERPGEGGAWRLAVKRGRDGKDGVLAEPRKPATVKLG